MAYNNSGKRNNSGSRRYNNKNRRNNNSRRHGNFDEENISPQQRRNFQNKCDSFIAKAKECLAAGERVDAEFNFQHAEHYSRMAKLGLENQQKQKSENETGEENAVASEDKNAEEAQSDAKKKDDKPKAAPKVAKAKAEKQSDKPKADKDAKEDSKQDGDAGEPTIAELPFMQPPAV